MQQPRKLILVLGTAMLLAAGPLFADAPIVELSAEASRPAPNDELQATVFAELAGPTLADIARQVNAQMAAALTTAKTYATVKTQSGGTSTYASYGKNGRIESWRMRSELTLESGDSLALADLLGKLQGTLGVASLLAHPSPETRQKAENEVMLDALGAFNARAKLLASALGKGYRIKQIAVAANGGRYNPPLMRAAVKMMSADAPPMPVEAGSSQVTATVSGQIELE